MKWQEITTSKWGDFDDVITSMTEQGRLLKDRFFFRGQSDKDWALIPSFTRILNKANGQGFSLAPFEAVVVRKFKAMAKQHIPHNITPDDDDIVGWWQLMQHYRAPTRLLDWTISPYVAAYFAVIENPDEDGVIWVVNYSCLEKAVDEEIKKNSCSTTETDTYYVMNPRLQGANFIRATNANYKNQRAVAQQAESTFTNNVFSDHGLAIHSLLYDRNEGKQKTERKTLLTGFNSKGANQTVSKPLIELKYFKIIIPKESKMDYLARLHTANISASSLFPGLDGVGSAINEEINWQFYVAINSNNH